MTDHLPEDLNREKSFTGEDWCPKLPASTEAMMWACRELKDHALQVFEKTLGHLDIPGGSARDLYFKELFENVSCIRLKTSEMFYSPDFSEREMAGGKRRKYHVDQALRHATAVRQELEVILKPLMLSSADLTQEAQSSFQRMVLWLMEAQRHLSALEVLENVKDRNYNSRAVKGGHAKPRPASQRDQRTLLKVMIKGLVNGDPGALDRAKRNSDAVAREWANEIHQLNDRFHIFNWNGIGKFQQEILTLLLERIKAGEVISDRHMRMRLMLQYPRAKHDDLSGGKSGADDSELFYDRGVRKGIKAVLVYLLEERFDSLPDMARDLVESTHDIEELKLYLDRLLEASTWQAVLINHEPYF